MIERRIEVTNTTPAPAVVRMYAAGASINDGTFVGDAGDTPNELSTWNAVRPGALDLDAGAHASVTVTNPVPSDAAPGERYAVVWAEIHSGASSLGAVAQVNRVGIRQYLSVGPGGPPAGPLPAGLGSSLAIGDSGQVVIPLDSRSRMGRERRASPCAAASSPPSPSRPRVRRAPVPAGPTDDRWPFLVMTGLVLVLLCAGLLWPLARRSRDTSPDRGPGADGRLVPTA